MERLPNGDMNEQELTQNLRSLAPALLQKAKQLELEIMGSTQNDSESGAYSHVTDADASGALRGAVEQISSLANRVEKLVDIQSRQLEAADLQLRFLKQRIETAESNAEYREASVVRIKKNAFDRLHLKKQKPRSQSKGINLSEPDGIRKFLDRELFDFSALEATGMSSQQGKRS